ncbi:hypothetical protein MMC20_003970 [Loxospora ochrophaea]|nr:hypothetical protein [Loxospora ochrophaea]
MSWTLNSLQIPEVPITQSQSLNSPSLLSKRNLGVFVARTCPDAEYHTFIKSWCTSEKIRGISSERGYFVKCRQRAGFILDYGFFCSEERVCFNRTDPFVDAQYAICTAAKKITVEQVEQPPAPASPGTRATGLSSLHPFGGGSGAGTAFRPYVAAASIVGEGGYAESAGSVSSLQISVRAKRELFGAKSYSTLDGGVSSCKDCNGVSIGWVSPEEVDVAVRVGLAAVGQKAKVYLGMFDEL